MSLRILLNLLAIDSCRGDVACIFDINTVRGSNFGDRSRKEEDTRDHAINDIDFASSS